MGKLERQREFAHFQQIAASLAVSFAVLPGAGLILGLGGALSNMATRAKYPFLNAEWLQNMAIIMMSAGGIVFDNLPLLMALGLAAGLAKSEKGVAALSTFLSYIIVNATISGLLQITGLLGGSGQTMVVGIQSLNMGVVGALIVAGITVSVHNRYSDTKLPPAFEYFSGPRFVPIIMSVVALPIGLIFFMVWPLIQLGILQLGKWVENAGLFAPFIEGFVFRAIMPLGLHHLWQPIFWQTAVGGNLEVSGVMYEGAQRIFFAQMADPTTTHFDISVAKFISHTYFIQLFTLPAAAAAIITCADKQHRKAVAAFALAALVPAFFTGITEPIEYLFLFAAPPLYLIYALLDGLAAMVTTFFNITIGKNFAGGLVDFISLGVLQGNGRTNYLSMLIIGPFWAAASYFIFVAYIKFFKVATIGRLGNIKFTTPVDLNIEDELNVLIRLLGGKDNIELVDCCMTRLRITVRDPKLVDVKGFSESDSSKGFIMIGNGVQIVLGPNVSHIKNYMNDYLKIVP